MTKACPRKAILKDTLDESRIAADEVATLDVVITGYGTIGRHVSGMLHARQPRYREQYGRDVRITGVCNSTSGLVDPGGLAPLELSDRASFTPGLTGSRFMSAAPAHVLIEAGPSNYDTGGESLNYLRNALARRTHAIAVSKGALVVDIRGLRDLATRNGVSLRFSGAAASALPTVDLIEHSLAGVTILGIEAVLTGTTNFVLNQRFHNGLEHNSALRLAQEKGIAEPDPAFDIDGWDTASKLVILANSALGMNLRLDALPREGIRNLPRSALKQWKAAGLTPRLVGFIEKHENNLRAGVELRAYPPSHPFAGLDGSMKALAVHTEEMGDLTILGGASNPRATAAAVLKDLEHVLRDETGHTPTQRQELGPR
jgi:homoserine dehydrogenase